LIYLVLDANVALDWFLPSEIGSAYSNPLANEASQGKVRFHVPLHFDVEVCGQLVKSHRRKPEPYSKKWLDTCLDTLDVLPVDTHAIGVNFRVLGDLARAYGLTVYDVPYFHLARMLEIPIASRDRGIIAACKSWHVVHWQPNL
jgi:predicted nucleic acid-binding protein